MRGQHRLRRNVRTARAAVTVAFWLLLMFAWLGGLLLGLWQAWQLFHAPSLAFEPVAAGMWLIIGFAAWLLALSFGWQRYWRR
jgi:hypothetical protein